MVAIPTQADIGFPVRVHWAADVGPTRPLSSVIGGCVHDTEGYFSSDEPYLAAPTDPEASCHALIAPDGTLVFMVPLEKTAWTPGNIAVAKQSINVEMSGFKTNGYTDAQYKSMANFYRWCVAQGCPIPAVYVGKSGGAGYYGHQDVLNPYWPARGSQWGGASNHTDPGVLFNWDRFIGLVKGADPVKPYNPNPKNFSIGQGALDAIRAEGMIALTNEQYYSPNAGQAPGLTQRSFTYASRMGITYQIEALQDQDEHNNPLPTWTTQIWLQTT